MNPFEICYYEALAFNSDLPEISDDRIPTSIQFMPPGKHTITPHLKGIDEPTPVTVTVDASVCDRLQESLAAVRAQGGKPYLDFNHNPDNGASAHIKSLRWGGDDPILGGVIADVEWTEPGREALAGKKFSSFSPRFFLNKELTEIVATGTNAGGLVNEPAFKTINRIVPVLAKAADSGPPPTKKKETTETMTDEEKKKMEELQAANKALNEANAELTEKNKALEAKEVKAAEAAAKEVLSEAIKAGVVEAKNEQATAAFVVMAKGHPEVAKSLVAAAAAKQDDLTKQTTPAGKPGAAPYKDDKAELRIAQAYQKEHGVPFQAAWDATASEREKAVKSQVEAH